MTDYDDAQLIAHLRARPFFGDGSRQPGEDESLLIQLLSSRYDESWWGPSPLKLLAIDAMRLAAYLRRRWGAWRRWRAVSRMPVTPLAQAAECGTVRLRARVAREPDGVVRLHDGSNVVRVRATEPLSTGTRAAAMPDDGALVEIVGRVERAPGASAQLYRGATGAAWLGAGDDPHVLIRTIEPPAA